MTRGTSFFGLVFSMLLTAGPAALLLSPLAQENLASAQPTSTPPAIELSGLAASGLLPLPARNEWGEGRGEGNPIKNGPPLLDPLLPLVGGEGEFLAASPVLFLNSMAVPWIPLPAPFTFPVQQRGERAG